MRSAAKVNNVFQVKEYLFERQGRRIRLLDGKRVEIWIDVEVVEKQLQEEEEDYHDLQPMKINN